jgi:Bacterial type II and III secretion system protein
VRALKGKGLFESLAEPNLITQDGKEASFLAGGEFPYPVVQGGGANQTVTIVFKEFGVRLRFTPTITGGGYVHLKVTPEVSTLDFANGVTMEGFRVPALSTRRTDTEVELRDGQTFAIAGLIDRNMDETLRRVPGIGDIPILGHLFRSSAYRKNSTELVVMITPHIMRRDSPGVTPNLPGLSEPFLPTPSQTMPMPPPAFSSITPDNPAGPARTVVSNTPAAPQPMVASAPAAGAPAPVAAVSAPVSQKPATNSPAAGSNAAPKEPGVSAANREAAERAQREIARLQNEQEERNRKAAEIEAVRAAEEEKKQKKELEIARKADEERQAREKKLEEKRLEEQAAIDRKRWIEQQEQAAKAKVVADKLAKEQARRDAEQQKIENERLAEEKRIAEKHQKAQDKLAREQASRNGELEKLITQYKRLTGEQQ